jgi:hypothetical protein
VAAVFDKFPALSQDRNVWSTILASVECFSFRNAAQIAIHSDRELKMNACEQYSGYLECLSDSLAMDRDFLQQVIELNPDALCNLPNEAPQHQFQDLLTDERNLKRFLADKWVIHDRLLLYLPIEVRTSRSFVKAWFTPAWRLLFDRLLSRIFSDKSKSFFGSPSLERRIHFVILPTVSNVKLHSCCK